MGLKILHTADWHMGSPFGSVSPEQRAFLRREQRLIPGKIAEICRREGCHLVLLAGDIFDGQADGQTVDLVRDALAECRVPVSVSPGNHDCLIPGSPWLEEAWPENVHIFTGLPESVVLPELDCRVYGAGYRSMDCPPLLEGFRAEGNQRWCIAVLHGDPVVKHSPCCPVTASQVRDSGLDYLALGHIHKTGHFRAGETLCAWPGCPMGRGWDETGEKGVNIVTLEAGVSLRQIPLDVPRFYETEAAVEGDAAAALEGVLPPAGSRDFYRITLTGWGEVNPEKLKRQFAHVPNLTLCSRLRQRADLWADLDEDTLEGTYFRLLREKLDAAAPEEKDRILLAAEISRKLLAGGEVTLL